MPDDPEQAHLALHRQREQSIRQSVFADVSRMADGAMAGLIGYYDERSYYLFALRRMGDTAELVLTERAGDGRREEILCQSLSLGATLAAQGTGLTRELSCPEAGVSISVSIRYLTDEGVRTGKRFTGATLGLAAIKEDVQ